MGGNGKHRWKISFYHRSGSSPKPTHNPPSPPPHEFICPISGSLMADPVVVTSGQTFERVSIQVCRDLAFIPTLDDTSSPDFTAVIPNLALKSAILSWCDSHSSAHPCPPDYSSVEAIVRAKMMTVKGNESPRTPPPPPSSSGFRASESELLKGVVENPPVIFSHAATEVNHRVNHFYSSSSEESVIVNSTAGGAASPFTPLPLATRPACYSSSSSYSSLSEITTAETENPTLAQNPNSNSSSSSCSSCSEENDIVAKLNSPEVHEQEEAVISLRKLTKSKEDSRIAICTPRLLQALRPLIPSRYCVVQTNAIASLVNLSLERANKVKIVRSGFVPLLIDVLKSGSDEVQEHSAGALFSLALEDENKMAIGVLGALQPLLHTLRSDSERTRHDSALALYHLSLIQSNRVKLVKLGAVSTLLSMVKSGESASRVVLILCNLAACNEGRSPMLDANAVEILVGLLREGREGAESETMRENCVAALVGLSHGSLRFKGLAKEARVVEVLKEIEDSGSERAREKARRLLLRMRGREDDEDADWEDALESGGLGRNQCRVGNARRIGNGPNSTNF